MRRVAMDIQFKIRKRKDSSNYQADFRFYNERGFLIQRERMTTGQKTLMHANEWCLQKRREMIENGCRNIRSGSILFKDYGASFLEKLQHKSTTNHHYNQVFRLYLFPYFSTMRMDAITLKEVESFDHFLVEKKLSKGYRRDILKKLSVLLKRSVRDHVRQFNPMAQYTPLVTTQEKEAIPVLVEPYSSQDCWKYIDTALRIYGVRKEFGVACITALCTGMRIGEVLGLLRTNIHPRKIQVRQQWNCREKKLTSLKSPSSSRDVTYPYILFNLERIFKEFLLAQKCRKKRLFLKSASNLRMHHHKIAKEAGLRRIKFHDLRMTYASLVANRVQNPKNLQRVLGHANIEMTMNIYVRFLKDDVEKDAAALQDLHQKAV